VWIVYLEIEAGVAANRAAKAKSDLHTKLVAGANAAHVTATTTTTREALRSIKPHRFSGSALTVANGTVAAVQVHTFQVVNEFFEACFL